MNTLLFFVKYPSPGKVKTRLAEKLGEQQAAHFYKEMVEELAQKIKPANGDYQCVLLFDPPQKHKEFQSWLPMFSTQRPQAEGDLGERLKTAFKLSFQKGAKKVIVIGSDCPDVDAKLLQSAFQKLTENGLVIGPAKDGGYYLLGLSEFHPELFEEISWSTASVLKQTLNKAKKLHLQITQLPTLSDIDSYDDALRYKK